MAMYMVIKRFRDKYRQVWYEEKSIYETDDEKRAEYLRDLGYLGPELVPKEEVMKKNPPKRKEKKAE